MSATIAVRVQASARENSVVGLRDGVLIVRVTAPAVEGRANESLSRLLAKRLRVPRSSVTVIRGQRSRDKVVEIEGLDPSTLMEGLTA
jgi:uncharacterized protein (TIGR00251 family)